MKTEFLKNLGITEQSVIDQIMAENGRDVGKAKGDLESAKSRISDLEKEVVSKNSEIATLTTKAGDTDALNQKISQLETKNADLEKELTTKVSQIQKTHAIETTIRDAKARNVKAVIAQLDMDKITFENGELGGLTEQLESLKSGEDTSFLFGDTTGAPSGTHINNPPNGGKGATPPTAKSFEESIFKALTKN